MGKNDVQYNVKSVHYALADDADFVGMGYEVPEALPGAVTLTMDPEGGFTPFYADGRKYYVAVSNQGYSGDLELAIIPDKFRTDVLGEEEDENTHVLVERSNAEPKPFALLFQVDKSNGIPVLFVFYNCTATRPPVNAETITDTKTPKTETIHIEAPPTAEEYVRAKTTDNTPEALKKNWFKQVWKPGDPVPNDSSVLGNLTIISAAGSTSGTTAITTTPAKESGNTYRVKAAANVTVPAYDADCSGSGYQDWDGSADITATTGQKLLVVECSGGKAKKAGATTITAKS